MVPLAELPWPILLAAVAMFCTSLALRVFLPHPVNAVSAPAHLVARIRELAMPRGGPALPLLLEERGRGGPVRLLISGCGTGRCSPAVMVQWFAVLLAIAVLTGYLAGLALVPGASFNAVLRFTTVVAFLANGTAGVHNSVWRGDSWRATRRLLLDALVLALVAGGVFAWLWPRP